MEAEKQQRHLGKILREVTSSDPSPFLKIAEWLPLVNREINPGCMPTLSEAGVFLSVKLYLRISGKASAPFPGCRQTRNRILIYCAEYCVFQQSLKTLPVVSITGRSHLPSHASPLCHSRCHCHIMLDSVLWDGCVCDQLNYLKGHL